MTNYEIIDNIRKIDNNDIQNIDSGIINILEKHQCFYMATLLASKLGVEYRKNAVFQKAIIKEQFTACASVFEDLSVINYAVIKGAHLSQQLYGNPYYRPSCDIDILIDPNDINYAKRILEDNGFFQGRIYNGIVTPYTRKEKIFYATHSHQIAQYIKTDENAMFAHVSIDVNTSIFWGEAKANCDMNKVLSNCEKATLWEIKYKKLSPEMEFISLCLHHFKDLNSVYILATRGIRLSTFCDIYYYVKNVKMDLNLLYKLSVSLGANPYLYYCLWFTNAIFESETIKTVLSVFNSGKECELLNCYGLSDTERRVWNMDFYDRLFSEDFKEKFQLSLDENLLQNIQVNKKYTT